MNNIEHNKIYRPQHWGNKLGVCYPGRQRDGRNKWIVMFKNCHPPHIQSDNKKLNVA